MPAAAKRGSAEKNEFVERLLKLPDSKKKRLIELVELHNKSEDLDERQEIKDTITEIIFRDQKQSGAVPISSGVKDAARNKLRQHRLYVGQQIK